MQTSLLPLGVLRRPLILLTARFWGQLCGGGYSRHFWPIGLHAAAVPLPTLVQTSCLLST
eukprot:1154721-Pelagomonas_calceolata.AAC.1